MSVVLGMCQNNFWVIVKRLSHSKINALQKGFDSFSHPEGSLRLFPDERHHKELMKSDICSEESHK